MHSQFPSRNPPNRYRSGGATVRGYPRVLPPSRPSGGTVACRRLDTPPRIGRCRRGWPVWWWAPASRRLNQGDTVPVLSCLMGRSLPRSSPVSPGKGRLNLAQARGMRRTVRRGKAHGVAGGASARGLGPQRSRRKAESFPHWYREGDAGGRPRVPTAVAGASRDVERPVQSTHVWTSTVHARVWRRRPAS